MEGSLVGEGDFGHHQVPAVQPHGADSGCAKKSSAESCDLPGGNSDALVEGLLPHAQPECEGAKAEAQAGCVV